MKNKLISKAGFSLLELLVVIIIITILTLAAIPYYQNATESARSAEAVVLWGNLKRIAGGATLTQTLIKRVEKDVNKNHKLNYFTLTLVCREKEDENEPCWEGELRLKNASQHIQYYFATENHFQTLLCVPLNSAGRSFCQSQAGRDDEPDRQINGQEAYTIHP